MILDFHCDPFAYSARDVSEQSQNLFIITETKAGLSIRKLQKPCNHEKMIK